MTQRLVASAHVNAYAHVYAHNQPPHSDALMAYIDLRPGGVDAAHQLAGTTFNRELAVLLEIDQSNLSRVIAGNAKPGIRFVAGIIAAFGIDHLLDVVMVMPDDKGEAA